MFATETGQKSVDDKSMHNYPAGKELIYAARGVHVHTRTQKHMCVQLNAASIIILVTAIPVLSGH